MEKVFENAIEDKNLKENLADLAISVLCNQKLIDLSKKDLKHLIVEFGYLFKTDNSDNPAAMFKIIIPGKMFKKEKVYYFGTQEGRLHLLNDTFTEESFRKVQYDMFTMHKVDIEKLNMNDFKMELY